MARAQATVERVAARAYVVPTDAPEADGTVAWGSTTLVLVEASAGGQTGIGYTYSDASVARLVERVLAPVVLGGDALAVLRHWQAMVAAVRNLGWRGLCAAAISAADAALWDLKARLLDVPLGSLLGPARDAAPIYGSGGFTSYDEARLTDQLGGWVEDLGCRWVKMKVGSEPGRDLDRARAAREAVGRAELMVDANGAYGRKQALWFADQFAGLGVT
jgi:L-alanine-DL-glutamate epimerase-like enolase superfamily enzyme